MKTITPRSLSSEEREVIRSTLMAAARQAVPAHWLGGLDQLQVRAVCECGCRSLYFTSIAAADERVADGVGRNATGTLIEVVLWANPEGLTALDIIDFTRSGELPDPATIAPL